MAELADARDSKSARYFSYITRMVITYVNVDLTGFFAYKCAYKSSAEDRICTGLKHGAWRRCITK